MKKILAVLFFFFSFFSLSERGGRGEGWGWEYKFTSETILGLLVYRARKSIIFYIDFGGRGEKNGLDFRIFHIHTYIPHGQTRRGHIFTGGGEGGRGLGWSPRDSISGFAWCFPHTYPDLLGFLFNLSPANQAR